MKCRECDACYKGYFVSKPEAYVCIGVPEPFVIEDINHDCTEYLETNKFTASTAKIIPSEPVEPYVGDDGIYVPDNYDFRCYRMLISKELFVEAYNKWIKGGK